MRRDETPPTTLDYARDGGRPSAALAIVTFVTVQLVAVCLETWMLLFIVGVVRMFWATGALLLFASCGGALCAIPVSLFALPKAKRGVGRIVAALHGIFLLIVLLSFVYAMLQPPRYQGPGGF